MTIPKLTLEQSAIITAYTGTLCGSGEYAKAFHRYAERILNRAILTSEIMGALGPLWDELESASRADFLALCASDQLTENQS